MTYNFLGLCGLTEWFSCWSCLGSHMWLHTAGTGWGCWLGISVYVPMARLSFLTAWQSQGSIPVGQVLTCKHLSNLCSVMLANVPLMKSSHMTKPRVTYDYNARHHGSWGPVYHNFSGQAKLEIWDSLSPITFFFNICLHASYPFCY